MHRRSGAKGEKGVDLSLAEIEEEQNERDLHDYNRPVGRLVKADDAVEVVTDGMSFEQVVHELVMIVRGSRWCYGPCEHSIYGVFLIQSVGNSGGNAEISMKYRLDADTSILQ